MSLNVQLYYGINQMIQNIGFSYQCHNTGRRVLCTYTMVHKITIFKGVLQEIGVMPRAGPEEVLHDTGIQRTLKVEVMLTPSYAYPWHTIACQFFMEHSYNSYRSSHYRLKQIK